MITGIKQQAIVGKNGKVEINASELPEGAIVEIIVLINTPEDDNETALSPKLHSDLIAAIDRVDARSGLISFTAEEWNTQYSS